MNDETFDQIIAEIERLRASFVYERKMYATASPDEPTLRQTLLSTQAAITAANLGMLRDRVEALRNEAEEAPVKPWHGANPGEVWVITYENKTQYALVDDDRDFIISDEGLAADVLAVGPHITAGRRVLEAIK